MAIMDKHQEDLRDKHNSTLRKPQINMSIRFQKVLVLRSPQNRLIEVKTDLIKEK